MPLRFESLCPVSERLSHAVAWLKSSGWPSRAQDVPLATAIYRKWITQTDAMWRSSGERDRYPLITALEIAFQARHGDPMAEHLCVLFTVIFENLARNAGANRQGSEH